MLARTPLGTQFYNWVASHDPDEKYNWQNRCECSVGLFLMEAFGYSRDAIQLDVHGLNDDPVVMDAWTKFNVIAGDVFGEGTHESWTFGKLRERIEKQMPEYVA